MKWPFIGLLLTLNCATIQAQLPPWNTKFVVYHPDGYTDTLWIGCDENATGGYDEGLDIIDTTYQYPLAIRGYSEEIENDSAFGTCVNLKRDIRNFGYPAVFTFYILNDEIGAEENIYLGWDSASCIYNYGSIKINYIKVSSSNGYLHGEGKRFMAYQIVTLLKKQNRNDILEVLQKGVTISEKKNNVKHKVFQDSFDCKECYSSEFIQQKLNYMHLNPLHDRWKLAEMPEDYLHSSARFYITGIQGRYLVTHYLEYYDVPIAK